MISSDPNILIPEHGEIISSETVTLIDNNGNPYTADKYVYQDGHIYTLDHALLRWGVR